MPSPVCPRRRRRRDRGKVGNGSPASPSSPPPHSPALTSTRPLDRVSIRSTYLATMSGTPPTSLTPPQGGSGSSSPTGAQSGARVVSTSLKDRIAKFNNPSAVPLVPTRPFGQAGPAPFASSNARGGMVGNQLPRLDPKTAGMVGGPRRPSENKGMIGNRLPSVGVQKPGRTGRSASPAGSMDSSVASGPAASSTSPVTSRSSSPPTSPGQGFPSSFLSATLPDEIERGAMTPSSTRAEAGEMNAEFSMPTTPVQGPTSELPDDPPVHDLSVGALGEHDAARDLQPGPSAHSAARRFASSIASSLASQYDPSSTGSEKQMLQDVSGISTPTGTPKAARRDLEGSMRGDGSVQGEGSARGDGSVAGDMDDLSSRLEGLGVRSMDRDETLYTPREEINPDLAGPAIDSDPNQASDLDDLTAGDLEQKEPASGTHHVAQNPTNSMAEAGVVQGFAEMVVPQEEKKDQGGVAGQLLPDVDFQDEIEPPTSSQEISMDHDRILRPANLATQETPNAPDQDTKGDDKKAEDPRNVKSSSERLEAQYEYRRIREKGLGQSEEEGLVDKSTGVRYDAAPADPYETKLQPDDQDEMQKAVKQKAVDVDLMTNSKGKKDAANPASEVSSSDRDLKAELEAQSPQADEPGAQPTDDEPATNPLQVQVEPAPIAQPIDEAAVEAIKTSEPSAAHTMQVDQEGTPKDTATLELPSVPHTEPLPPTHHVDRSRPSSTPVDASMLRSFPDVPDEDKPRVEVHVSSPQNTPQKGRSGSQGANQGTPVAQLPGHSKSLSNPPAEAMGTPGNFPDRIDEVDNDATPQTARPLTKRLSTRRSPKSPLLDDEDPGDYEAGEEGWAVVTQ